MPTKARYAQGAGVRCWAGEQPQEGRARPAAWRQRQAEAKQRATQLAPVARQPGHGNGGLGPTLVGILDADQPAPSAPIPVPRRGEDFERRAERVPRFAAVRVVIGAGVLDPAIGAATVAVRQLGRDRLRPIGLGPLDHVAQGIGATIAQHVVGVRPFLTGAHVGRDASQAHGPSLTMPSSRSGERGGFGSPVDQDHHGTRRRQQRLAKRAL